MAQVDELLDRLARQLDNAQQLSATAGRSPEPAGPTPDPADEPEAKKPSR